MKFDSIEQAQALWQFLPPEQQAEAHDYVVQQKAKQGGATYDSVSGKWSDQKYGDDSGSPTKGSGKTNADYQKSAEKSAAKDIRAALGGGEAYDAMSDDEIMDYAANLSQTRYDAAIQALRDQGGALKTDYEGALGELEAMYANREAMAKGLIDKAGAQARDEAIARGGQRGGLETYIEEKLDKQIMGDLANTENQIMAKKNSLRGAYDQSTKANMNALNQALLDKGAFQASTAFETKAGQADKSAYYKNAQNQWIAPYLMETANQARGSDLDEVKTYGYKSTGQFNSPTAQSSLDSAIAALQKQAGDTYNSLSAADKANPNIWTQNQTLSSLHNQVAGLQQGSGRQYDPIAGKWSTLDKTLAAYGL